MRMFTVVLYALVFMLSGVIGVYAIDQTICDSGSTVVFYPNGSLRSCVLKDNFRSNDINCNEHRPISFYSDGRLERCDLAESATVSGQACKQFDPVDFYPDGRFKSCVKRD